MSRQSSDERIRVMCACFTLLALLLCNFCHGQDAASVEKVWRERSERIKELHLKWTEQSTHYTLPGETAEREGEFAISVEGRFLVVGDSYSGRERFGPGGPRKGIDPKTVTTIRQQCVNAYDGVTVVMLFGPKPEQEYHALFIDTGFKERPRLDMVANQKAVQWFCRPFDQASNALGEGLSGFRSRPDQFDGEKCLVLEKDLTTIWVTDDERALLLRTVREREKGIVGSDIRVRYAKDSASGEWLPSGWDYKSIGVDGKFLIESRRAKVTEASVHSPLPVDLFRVTIPEGTWVTEHVDGKGKVYIQRSEKGPRYVLPYEFTGDNYKALLNSESPVAKPSTSTK